MDMKQILFLIFITAILIGAAHGAKVNDFTPDKNYKSAYQGKYYSLYLNDNKDSGITVYENVDDDAYGDIDDDGPYDDLIHDDGREYLTMDDDFQIEKNDGNIVEFKDLDHSQHGTVEVVEKDGSQYIVVFWAKDSSDVKNSELNDLLKEFNKDNKVEAVAF